MNAIFHEEITETNFDIAGGSYQVEVISGDYVCTVCGCYVDELDEDVYFCRKCNKAN